MSQDTKYQIKYADVTVVPPSLEAVQAKIHEAMHMAWERGHHAPTPEERSQALRWYCDMGDMYDEKAGSKRRYYAEVK